MNNSHGESNAKKEKPVNLIMSTRVILVLVLLLVTAVTVSAQNSNEEIDLGEPVILSETSGPEGTRIVVEIPVAKDTYIASGTPNTNYGTAPSIRLGHNAGGQEAMRPLVQFSTATIPPTAQINDAYIQIYLFNSTGGTTPMGFIARHLVSSWNEGLVTWNSHQPEWGDVFSEGVATATPLGWKEVDVTNLVREWQHGTQPNNGITVIGDETPGLERQRWYYSKDAGNGLYPRLVVDYIIPPPDSIPPQASVEPLDTWSPVDFTVNWDGEDNVNGSGIAYFDVQYRANFGTWHDWKMHTTAKSAIFEGGNHNTIYEFRARAVDNAGNVGAWPAAQAQTRVDTVAPVTTMTPLPEYTTSSSFTVSWQGSDPNSGINHYDLQGRINGGSWSTILQNTTQTSFRVTGFQNGDFLEFRARAVDNVGNDEPFSEYSQASTTVILEPLAEVLPFDPIIVKPTDPITDSFSVNWVGFTAPGTTITLYELRYRFRDQATGTVSGWTGVSLPSPTAQSVTFNVPSGNNDGTYEFEVRAVNSLGQTEPFTGQAEAAKIIDLQAPFIEPTGWLPFIGRQ